MTAINKDPFVYSKSKDGKPSVFRGLVQAGSSAAIKIGEICTWNETTGYFIPVNAVADHRYPLAIAKEEQKSSGRGELTASRYIEFYSLDPNDVFEFVIDAAAAVELGTPYTLTTSDSQKLTAAAGDFAVAINVDDGHYPQEEDTTIRSISYARVSFNPAVSWWGYRMSQFVRPGRRVIVLTDNATLAENDMYNTLITQSGTAKTIILPAVKPGMDVIIVCTVAQALHVDPNASDAIRLDGTVLTAGNKLSSASGAGDMVHLITESVDGFIVINRQGTWTDGS
ncbi:MAG: hypothetical protein ABIG61_02290 [Planctomycetota bacterium]